MSPPIPDAKPFAWAGIALQIPGEWETGQLDTGYALLEHRFRPVLELKSAIIRGRFSFQRHLSQLARSRRNRTRVALENLRPPPDWPAFPATAEIRVFRWRAARIGGIGLLHFCRHCRRATLIQFYDHGDQHSALIAPILASFQDHDRSSAPSVAVYDIRAVLPARLTLARFHFAAGRFELVFGASRESVTLWRWSAADIIMEQYDHDLTGLVRGAGLLPPAVSLDGQPSDGPGLEWHWPPLGFRDRLRNRFCPPSRQRVHGLRIWHRPEAKRILAVRGDGLEGFSEFDAICRSYEII
jgi:hypothetical protein